MEDQIKQDIQDLQKKTDAMCEHGTTICESVSRLADGLTEVMARMEDV
jgi:hypothetical protein